MANTILLGHYRWHYRCSGNAHAAVATREGGGSYEPWKPRKHPKHDVGSVLLQRGSDADALLLHAAWVSQRAVMVEHGSALPRREFE